MERYWLAVQIEHTLIWPVHAAEDLHERGFTRAIFPDKRHHFGGKNFEVHRAQSGHARKALNDALHLSSGVAIRSVSCAREAG